MRFFFSILFIVYAGNFLQAQSGLEITPLTTNFYVYTTKKVMDGEVIPSNSMYLVTNEGVVLFDTPWDTTQLRPLLDTIMSRHNKKVIMSISTHYHADRTAGLTYLASKGVKTYAYLKTYELGKLKNEELPQHLIYSDTTFKIGNYTFETFFPGAGHTPDNIVVWFPLQKVLYGGCLVKSTEAKTIGYIGDANLTSWKKTIKVVKKEYRNAKFIIPGHYAWESNKSLRYTKKMVRKEIRNQKV